MTVSRLIPVLTVGCALLAAQGMATEAVAQAPEAQPAGAAVVHTTEALVTVESVDQTSREVVLRGTSGNQITLVTSPAVNLAQVKPGDRVVVRYIEALAASLAKPGQGGSGSIVEQSGVTRGTPEGTRPAGRAERLVGATVTIEAIDRATHRVSFTGPGGTSRTVAVRDPEARRFLETLKAGDRVDLVYTESLAVAVEPASR
jgi:hypothetical protein